MTKSKQKMPPGPAVLILLIATVVAATAAPTNAPTIFDTDARAVRAAYAMTPTCGADARAKELPPCHPGYERSPSSRPGNPRLHGVGLAVGRAEPRRRRPLVTWVARGQFFGARVGVGCPAGYSLSPT